MSANPFLSQQWYHWAKSLVQSASSGGFFIWIRLRHRLHFNFLCVSDSVSSNLNKSLNSATLKCLAVSSFISTTVELSAFLCACLWNIFSSMVPACKITIKETPQCKKSKSYCQKPVYITGFLLPVPPDSGHGLVVVRGVPIWVEHDKPVCAYEIQATPASLRAQHENELFRLGIVEIFHDLRPFLDWHGSVQPDVQITPEKTYFYHK